MTQWLNWRTGINSSLNVGRAYLPVNQCRSRFDPWVGKIPWRRHGNPLQSGKSCGQKSLAGYSPQERRESDTMEALERACTHARTHAHTHTHTWCHLVLDVHLLGVSEVTDSISLLVTDLFPFSVSSEFSLRRWNISQNLSISSRLSVNNTQMFDSLLWSCVFLWCQL